MFTVTGTGTGGGFLVPIEFHDKLIALAVENEVVRKRATHVPCGSALSIFPCWTSDENL